VALGADVTVISHSPDKETDAKQLGAQHFISSKDKDWQKNHQFAFDFVLNTANVPLDYGTYFSIVKVNGHFHNVG
jgi:alcohol dehydrogenase (NADP+)